MQSTYVYYKKNTKRHILYIAALKAATINSIQKLSPSLSQFQIYVVYASRSDSSCYDKLVVLCKVL